MKGRIASSHRNRFGKPSIVRAATLAGVLLAAGLAPAAADVVASSAAEDLRLSIAGILQGGPVAPAAGDAPPAYDESDSALSASLGLSASISATARRRASRPSRSILRPNASSMTSTVPS